LPVSSAVSLRAKKNRKQSGIRNLRGGGTAGARGSTEIFEQRNLTLEREMLAFFLRKAAELPPTRRLTPSKSVRKSEGRSSHSRRGRLRARGSLTAKISQPLKLSRLCSKRTPAQLREMNEPLIDFASEIAAVNSDIAPRTRAFNASVASGGHYSCKA
jgi:hypothetical protein